MEKEMTLDSFNIGRGIPLEPCRGWPKKAIHQFDRKQAIAVLAARAIHRPLLVKGEPGCGKTQLARAVAQVFGMPLAGLVVNERTETEDLLWRYDALRRLSDANNPDCVVDDEKRYLSAGPLWWAIDHESAQEFEGRRPCTPDLAEKSKNPRAYENGVVLLIDEIDKADRSVPNSLLESLGNLSFDVPYIEDKEKRRIELKSNSPAPLIIITTNNEQELPQAFTRRCLVLNLGFKDKEAFLTALTQRGQALFGKEMPAEYGAAIFEDVADNLYKERKLAEDRGLPFIPGQAEYLDHLEALIKIHEDHQLQPEEARSYISQLTFAKNGD